MQFEKWQGKKNRRICLFFDHRIFAVLKKREPVAGQSRLREGSESEYKKLLRKREKKMIEKFEQLFTHILNDFK